MRGGEEKDREEGKREVEDECYRSEPRKLSICCPNQLYRFVAVLSHKRRFSHCLESSVCWSAVGWVEREKRNPRNKKDQDLFMLALWRGSKLNFSCPMSLGCSSVEMQLCYCHGLVALPWRSPDKALLRVTSAQHY